MTDPEPILALAGKLAAPYDLATMLVEVVDAATQVLGAERASVWLYEADGDELVLRVASDIAPVRMAAGAGIVGTCARTRKLINVQTATPMRASIRASIAKAATARAACWRCRSSTTRTRWWA